MAKKAGVKKKTAKKAGGKKKAGLYDNLNKAKKRAARGGRPTRKKGEKGAPTDADFAEAAKTAKK